MGAEEKNSRIMRYSMQLAILKEFLRKGLLSEYEFNKIKRDLMKDYHIISHIDSRTST